VPGQGRDAVGARFEHQLHREFVAAARIALESLGGRMLGVAVTPAQLRVVENVLLVETLERVSHHASPK